jgi:hypothetical protein
VDCIKDTFDVAGEPARGVKIGDITQKVLSWTAADRVPVG